MPTSSDSPTAGEISEVEGGPVEETNFPPIVEVPEDIPAAEPDESPVGEEGQIFATWVGQQPSRRILTVEDLKSLGDSEAEFPLIWDAANRWVVEVTLAHPMVLRYLEEIDDNFKVERF